MTVLSLLANKKRELSKKQLQSKWIGISTLCRWTSLDILVYSVELTTEGVDLSSSVSCHKVELIKKVEAKEEVFYCFFP